MCSEIGHFGKPGFLKVAIYGNCVAKRKIVIFKIIHRLLLHITIFADWQL